MRQRELAFTAVFANRRDSDGTIQEEEKETAHFVEIANDKRLFVLFCVFDSSQFR